MKAVTDTKYYDEIAKKLFSRGAYLPALTPADMAEAVEEVADLQYRDGYAEGETNGRKAQYDEFWDVYQNYGNGSYMASAFSYQRWTDEIYNPKYPIKSINNNLNSLFYSSKVTNTKVPIYAEGCTADNCFAWSSVKTVPLFIVDENTNFTNYFRGANNIVNITIEGTIASSFSINESSKLTSASVDSIIGALKTLTTDDEAKTLTLHSTVKKNLTDTQTATIQEKGWTLA